MHTIKLPQDLVNQLEKLQYEVDARRGLIEFLLNKNYDITSGTFKEYHDEYVNKHVEFEQLKNQITTSYVAPLLTEEELKTALWNVDFETCELTF